MTEVRRMADFMKESEGWCYAYASRLVYEDEGEMRSGVEFEVIQSQKLSAFLKRDRALTPQNQDSAFAGLLEHYLEYGADNDIFYHKKLAYLGNSETVFYLTVWFKAPAEAVQIVLTNWYIIEDEGEFGYQVIPFMSDEIIKVGTCKVKSMKQPDQDTLNTLLSIKSLEGKTENRKKDLNGNFVQAVNNNTKFFGVNFYYVGAALCAGIYSSRYSPLGLWLPNKTEIYFDFGYKSGATSSDASVVVNSNKAIANLAIIRQDLVNEPEKIVFISHWHSDHISLVSQIDGDPSFNRFWEHSTWYVPETSAPVANIVANNLRQNHGTMITLKNVFPADNTVKRINNNPNLLYGKIDAFNAAEESGKHPHHHGIYAKVKLIDFEAKEDEEILLVGDCTYSGIPDVRKNDCAFLQACHHGGEYSLPPCNQSRAVNQYYIPTPLANDDYRYVIYSANGHTHGHPNPEIVDLHTWRGWAKDLRTYQPANGQLWATYYGVK